VRTCWFALENRTSNLWQQTAVKIQIGFDGAPIAHLELPHPVAPWERLTLYWIFRTVTDVGRHEFTFDLVSQADSDPAVQNVPTLRVACDIVEAPITPTRRLRDQVYDTYSRCWLPADGMTWSSAGSGYPQFARTARGCRITDIEGREYIDYLMGWGCALLGYANERIQRAVAEALPSGAMLTLTHELMPEVGEMLCDMFPGASAATFGKNGSDVCTAAVRLARAHTGRPMILFCGYHGWQDWYVERLGFDATGVPARDDSLIAQFEFNNLDQVEQLLRVHRGRVAAIMLEPAGPLEGSNGPIKDVDPNFLKEVAGLAVKEGALLIFDEIMSGFRYRGGSVQHATGVVPDLTCLGKALTAGMPLSALIGRREIFHSSIGRIHYEPTFKGDMYALAAAREALTIYREQDVPARIWAFGNRLRDTVNQLCEDLGVAAKVIGPPYRMLLSFVEEDRRRLVLMRTLVQQELLRQGILTTQHLLLPSLAHDDEVLEITRRAYKHALEVLAEATENDSFAERLEIPPLPG
jgi:glutamate-1-semialdehyde aminotransferase